MAARRVCFARALIPGCAYWSHGRDGEDAGIALHRRHYSYVPGRAGKKRRKFVGPGYHMVLISPWEDALFVWRKFIDDSGQTGINCAIFRNDSSVRSSEMIREADALAFARWPGERHYTYVNPKRIRGSNPGYCFLCAGWRRCGMTKGGLVILERLHEWG